MLARLIRFSIQKDEFSDCFVVQVQYFYMFLANRLGLSMAEFQHTCILAGFSSYFIQVFFVSVSVPSGYKMDYMFDWTILKYQQTQRSKSQLELPVSTFITSFFGGSVVFLCFKYFVVYEDIWCCLSYL